MRAVGPLMLIVFSSLSFSFTFSFSFFSFSFFSSPLRLSAFSWRADQQ
jgi:hypothetical protein